MFGMLLLYRSTVQEQQNQQIAKVRKKSLLPLFITKVKTPVIVCKEIQIILRLFFFRYELSSQCNQSLNLSSC